MHSGEIMVVMIVLIFAVGRFLRDRHGGRREPGSSPMPAYDGDAEALRTEVRQLKDRVQVLEAIVTDSDRNRSLALEHEIERLRDRRDPSSWES